MFAIAAVASYLGCVAATLWVLLPHELVLEFSGSVVLEEADRSEADLEALQRVATRWLDNLHEHNRSVLKRIGHVHAAACVALGAEIVLWTASYGDKLV